MPGVIRQVAKVVRELRAAANDVMRELSEAVDEKPARPAPPPPPRKALTEQGDDATTSNQS